MNRRTISGSPRNGSRRTLTARSRPRSASYPLSTTPMPPRPITSKSWSRSVCPCSAGTIPAVDASLVGTPVPASVSQGATSGTRPIDWASVDRMLSSAVPRVNGIPGRIDSSSAIGRSSEPESASHAGKGGREISSRHDLARLVTSVPLDHGGAPVLTTARTTRGRDAPAVLRGDTVKHRGPPLQDRGRMTARSRQSDHPATHRSWARNSCSLFETQVRVWKRNNAGTTVEVSG